MLLGVASIKACLYLNGFCSISFDNESFSNSPSDQDLLNDFSCTRNFLFLSDDLNATFDGNVTTPVCLNCDGRTKLELVQSSLELVQSSLFTNRGDSLLGQEPEKKKGDS